MSVGRLVCLSNTSFSVCNMLQCYIGTMLQCYSVYNVTMSHRYNVTISKCYNVKYGHFEYFVEYPI